jgi:ankyrin repeat protein
MHVLDISKGSRGKLETPLQAAIRSRRRDVVEHFLDLGADVNALSTSLALGYEDEDRVIPARTALQHAVALRDLPMIDLLLDAGADVNAPAGEFKGATALQIAAATGQIGLARRLIAFGADIDAPGARYGGRTALEAAAERGRLDMVQFLLECGVCSDQYETAMDIALAHGYMATVDTIREWMTSEGTQQRAMDEDGGI